MGLRKARSSSCIFNTNITNLNSFVIESNHSRLNLTGCFFFFQAEDGIRDIGVTGVQTCALPISLAEKRQMSATATPVAGRCKATGFPASEQELLAVEKAPRAATFRSTSALGRETPAVEGATTTMSLDVAERVALGRGMTSPDGLRAGTQ